MVVGVVREVGKVHHGGGGGGGGRESDVVDGRCW